jgi:hypothetical protein
LPDLLELQDARQSMLSEFNNQFDTTHRAHRRHDDKLALALEEAHVQRLPRFQHQDLPQLVNWTLRVESILSAKLSLTGNSHAHGGGHQTKENIDFGELHVEN